MSSDDPNYDISSPEERGKYLDQPDPVQETQVEQFTQASQLPKMPVTDDLLRNDVKRADSWLVYNKGLEQTGFSPANELRPDNVGTLERKYTIETEGNGLETNPVVVPSDPPVMYYTVQGAWKVIAANARTGEKYWSFQLGLPDSYKNLDLPMNRGVAVWQDTVYFASPKPSIVAINRYTGKQRWETDLKVPKQNRHRLFLTQAPVAYGGRVYVGQSSDYAEFTTVSSLDAKTGEIAWQYQTAPKDEWVGDTWEFSSCAAWMSPTIDPESDTVFFSVGNADPMLNGLVRPGPNRDSNSLLALDAKSGDVKWKQQISPHDLWDYDVHPTPRVYNLKVDGETRRVVSTIWKAGWIYVYDIETGQLVSRSPPITKQGGEAFLSLPGAGEENAKSMFPPTTGATEWPPDTYSPQTGLHYVGVVDAGQKVWYDPDWSYKDYNRETFAYGGGTTPISDRKNAAKMVAVDAVNQEIAWEYNLPDAKASWPYARLFTGGTTSTAGNLVFHGSTGGSLIALNAETGEELWKDDTGTRITAAPVIWEDPGGGKQHVSVAAGGEIITYTSSD